MKASDTMYDVREAQKNALYDAICKASGAEAAEEIVYGRGETEKAADDSNWVPSAMRRLEEKFEPETVKRIRQRCQCGYEMDAKRALVREWMRSASSMEEFAASQGARAAGLFYENGTLFLQFLFCPCPILANVDRLETKTWCQCTTGYSKILFEEAFGCEVDVELLKSVKTGDDVCLMSIVPRKSVWPRAASTPK